VAGAIARRFLINNGEEALRNDESVQIHLETSKGESNTFANFLPAKKVAPKMFAAAAYSGLVVSLCLLHDVDVLGNWCRPDALNNSNQNLHDAYFVRKLAIA
jgi:hypothetical protein